AAAIGEHAVGRPNNTGGAEQIAELLSGLPEHKRPKVIVLGEYDPTARGTWPGRDGAVKVAGELQRLLGQGWVVRWAVPPQGSKDLRAWVNGLKLDPACSDEWSEAGEKLWRAIEFDLQAPPEGDAGQAAYAPD